MLSDLQFMEAKVRSLESESRALRETLWDRFFIAALGATLHHGKTTGVRAAAEIADEAIAIREARFRPLKAVSVGIPTIKNPCSGAEA